MSMETAEMAPLCIGRRTLSSAESALAQLPNRIAGTFKNMLDAIWAYKQRKANEVISSMIDDHTLRDIGITRFELNCLSAQASGTLISALARK